MSQIDEMGLRASARLDEINCANRNRHEVVEVMPRALGVEQRRRGGGEGAIVKQQSMAVWGGFRHLISIRRRRRRSRSPRSGRPFRRGAGHKWRLIDEAPWRRCYVVLKPGAPDLFVAN